MAACSNVAVKTMYCSTLVPHHHWVVNTSVGPTFLEPRCFDETVSPKKLHRFSLSLFFMKTHHINQQDLQFWWLESLVPTLPVERKGRLGLTRLGMAKVVWIRCAFVPVVVSRRGLGSSCPPCRPARTGRPSMGQTLYREKGRLWLGLGQAVPKVKMYFFVENL